MSSRVAFAYRAAALTLAWSVAAFHSVGCPSEEPEPPVDPDPGEMPEPIEISRGVMMTPGGKLPYRNYWVWNPEADEGDGEWQEQQFIVTPITLPNAGLAGGAQAAATSTGGGAPNGQGMALPNAVLFAGGIGPRPNFNFASPQAYFYDFAANEWTGLTMASPRTGHTLTTLLDGRVLIVGGWDGSFVPNASGGNDSPTVAACELFDPLGKSMKPAASLIAGRTNHAAARLADGRVLVTGGVTSTYDRLVSTEIYDPASDAFSTSGVMSQPRSSHLAVTLDDGRVLVCGANALKTAEVFDPATATFSSIGEMTSFHGFGATATKLQSGKVLILGGLGDDRGVEPTAAAELFDPATNTFTAVAPMSRPRSTHVAVLLDDGTVLVAGGNTVIHEGSNVSFEPTAACELFNATTNTFSPLPDSPTSSADGAGVFLKR